MNKKKKKKIIIISVVLILLLCIGIGIYFYVHKKPAQEPVINKVEVLDRIVGYEYSLEDRDTELYKENFLELKNLLETEEEIDFKKYAELIAKLFIIDLYTIQNKITKYDVGSLDFIYPEEQEKFRNKVMDTMYKLVEDNTTNTRKQELPVVKNVELKNSKETKYKKGNTTLNGFTIEMTIQYEKDLGYDKNATLTLVREENKIYVVNITVPE